MERSEEEIKKEKLNEDPSTLFATPAEKMSGDMDALKTAVTSTDASPEEKKKMDEQIKGVADSILSANGGNLSPEKLKENTALLKGLSDKGYEQATDVLSKVDEMTRQTTGGVGLGTVLQTAGGLDKMATGLEKGNLGQMVDGELQAATGAGQIYAASQGLAPVAGVTGELITKGYEQSHLKDTLNALSNYGKGSNVSQGMETETLTAQADIEKQKPLPTFAATAAAALRNGGR